MSPLVRAWLAERLPDWADHAYACWRGLTHSLGITLEWDPLELGDEYKLPAPVNADTVAAGEPGTAVPTPPSPAFNLLLPCPTCGAHSNAPCVNRWAEATGPHKRRRDAAEAAGELGGADRDEWDADEYGDHQYDDLPDLES